MTIKLKKGTLIRLYTPYRLIDTRAEKTIEFDEEELQERYITMEWYHKFHTPYPNYKGHTIEAIEWNM